MRGESSCLGTPQKSDKYSKTNGVITRRFLQILCPEQAPPARWSTAGCGPRDTQSLILNSCMDYTNAKKVLVLTVIRAKMSPRIARRRPPISTQCPPDSHSQRHSLRLWMQCSGGCGLGWLPSRTEAENRSCDAARPGANSHIELFPGRPLARDNSKIRKFWAEVEGTKSRYFPRCSVTWDASRTPIHFRQPRLGIHKVCGNRRHI